MTNSEFARNINIEHEAGFKKFLSWYVLQRRFLYQDVNPQELIDRAMAKSERSFKTVIDTLMDIFMEKSHKHRWGEKTPGHELYLRQIFQMYPDAKVIYLVRDPRAVSASLKNVPWGGNFVGSHIKIWKQSVKELELWRQDPRVMVVKFEDLVQNTAQITQQLCEFANVEFTLQMISNRKGYQKQDTKDWTGAYEVSVAKEITSENIARWESELSVTDIRLIENLTEPFFSKWYPGKRYHGPLGISEKLTYYFNYIVAGIKSKVKFRST